MQLFLYFYLINYFIQISLAIIFRSMEILYFTWLLPFKCYDSSLVFPDFTSVNIGLMTWINSILYMCFFELCYREDELQMQAKALGYWKVITSDEINSIQYKFFLARKLIFKCSIF